jgi:hypothetical protein
MVIHVCPICSKEFTKKSSFINHTENKKKPCKPNEVNNEKNLQEFAKSCKNLQEFAEKSINLHKNNEKSIILEEKKENEKKDNIYSCNYCYKNFYSIYTLKRHLEDSCKVKKLEVEKKENILNNLIEKEKINNLYTMYEELNKNNEELIRKNEELNKKIEGIVKKILAIHKI